MPTDSEEVPFRECAEGFGRKLLAGISAFDTHVSRAIVLGNLANPKHPNTGGSPQESTLGLLRGS